jgi:hypothetical protein
LAGLWIAVVNPFGLFLAASATSPNSLVDQANAFFEWTSSILWGPWLLVLLVGTHLYLTLRLGVIQRWLWPAIRP